MASKDNVFVRMNEEFEWIWKETDIAYSKMLSQHCVRRNYGHLYSNLSPGLEDLNVKLKF
jgi:hypothetical protein